MSDKIQPLHGLKLGIGVFLLSLATFVVILDATIINVAIPHIAGTFAVSLKDATWVITSYAVAEALTIPLSAWLADRLGLVRVLALSTLGFGVVSLMCALTTDIRLFVFLRILQGLCGGPLIPLSQTLIMKISPPKYLEVSMGLWMMTSIVAPIAGPLLGGILADTVGWRWAFYINIPVAGFCGYVLPRFFARFETEIRKIKVDYVGMLLLAVWVGSFQIVLDIGEDLAWFQSFAVFALSVLSFTTFLIFLVWEFTSLFPAVDIRVFFQKDFSIACAIMFFGFGAFFAALVLLPLWLQTGLGYSAKDAGNILAIQGILGVATAPVAAAFIKKTDPRLLMSIGLCLIGAGILYRVFFPPIIATGSMIGPQLIIGVGIPLLFVPLMTVSLNMVSPSMIAPASSAINFVRTIAAAISTATVVSAWDLSARTTRAVLTTGLNVSGLDDGSNRDLSDAAPALLEQAVVQQSLTIAFNHLSLIIAAILFFTAVLVWLLPKIDATKPVLAH